MSNSYISTNNIIQIDITKLNTIITTILNNTVDNVTLKINMTIKDTNRPITNETITILNGQWITVGNGTVDENGTVTIKTNITNGGNYNLTINYDVEITTTTTHK